VEPKAVLKYNKHYIGLSVNAAPLNFVTFIPRRAHVIMGIKLPKTKEFDELLEAAGIDTMSYDTHWGDYRVRVDAALEEKQREAVVILARESRANFGR